MKKYILTLLTGTLCSTLVAQTPQTKMRDIFAQAPDSIFAMLSHNNKLDLIDFAEANMEARVRNILDEDVILEQLTEDYMSLWIAKDCNVEIKMLPTSQLLVNKTYSGPGLDSEVRLYDTQWNLLRVVPRPDIDLLMTEPNEDVKVEATVLPLISAKLSPDNYSITWTLQSQEMTKETKKKAEKCLQSVVEDSLAL